MQELHLSSIQQTDYETLAQEKDDVKVHRYIQGNNVSNTYI